MPGDSRHSGCATRAAAPCRRHEWCRRGGSCRRQPAGRLDDGEVHPGRLAAIASPGAIKGIKGIWAGAQARPTCCASSASASSSSRSLIEGTQELEPVEESFTTFAEAIALVEGTYYLYVSAEAPREKGAEPDTVLARKRVAKVWGLMAAAGVSDQKVVAVTSLPPAMSEGRKLPKAGSAKVEIIKMDQQP